MINGGGGRIVLWGMMVLPVGSAGFFIWAGWLEQWRRARFPLLFDFFFMRTQRPA